ncbi:hypothetical protein AC792_10535 [Arthrobacter sp. RIT-PI-e]|uniref:hypothetical protein n=1 Tax=Arthrobacter sp. RIT-PI-e TaxID=1681197 RepID=UPI000676258C|nr:hypothetical protein [Arthrobacter sp. RIT-PI-e]KNC18722.1 hypothetical protein AC792_10535 [Arthrobacter sp. RIT-PI-e]
MSTLREMWASPGWRQQAQGWIDLVLGGLGVVRTGAVEQPRIRSWSTHLTVPTDHGLLWFKENNPGQLAEAAVMTVLGDLAPDHVSAPLATEPSRGWMLTADHGATLDTLTENTAATWSRVVSDFADLQKRVAPHGERLSGAGLSIMNPEVAAQFVESQLHLHTGLPVAHPLHLTMDQAREVLRRLPAVDAAVEVLRGVGVPLSLDHNDLHTRNCFLPGTKGAPVRFSDFADAYWAHPFSTLLVPVTRLCEQWGVPPSDPRISSVISAYLERWTDHAPLPELLPAVEPGLQLAGVHRYGSWVRLLVHADDDALRTHAPQALHHLLTLMDPVLGASGRHP